MNPSRYGFVLGVHPTSRGFGWALFEGPLSPFDWGTVELESDKREGTVERLELLFVRYVPSVLALEAFEGAAARRAERIREVGRAMVEAAERRAIEVAIYSRAAIHVAFAGTGARTRAEIADAIASRIEALDHRKPPAQKPWIGEHPNMSIFSAAACALTHFAHTSVNDGAEASRAEGST